jgi:hypothetical protein
MKNLYLTAAAALLFLSSCTAYRAQHAVGAPEPTHTEAPAVFIETPSTPEEPLVEQQQLPVDPVAASASDQRKH